MSAQADPTAEAMERTVREYERASLRLRNGLRFASGYYEPELGQSPKETVWGSGRAELWRYQVDEVSVRPPVLILPSLVSRSYVLDLQAHNSFVGALGRAGIDVFLLDWGVADERDSGNTFETYVDEMIPAAMGAVRDTAGAEDATVLGHCFGGVLALLLAAARPELRIRNLVTTATPADYDKVGVMVSLLREGRLEPEDVIDETGNVPPEVITQAFKLVKPTDDMVQYVTLWENMWNDKFLEGYMAINTWAKDQVPFPGALCRQVTASLIRRNALVKGEMPLGSRTISLENVRCPYLNVVAEKDNIVPIESAEPLAELVGSDDAETLRLRTGHIGYVVGRAASQSTVPSIIDWIVRHSEPADGID
jgi:poly[(R)-3-hydroxyalkanoate] polymerase subunit PhaC